MTQENVKRVIRLGWIPVLVAALYAGWIFYSRHSSASDAEHQMAEESAREDRKLLDRLGGGNLKILSFYGSPGVIRKGEAGLICYGVSNATKVRVEPDGPEITPALSKCVEVRPETTTAYRLLAESAAGDTAEAETTVRVE